MLKTFGELEKELINSGKNPNDYEIKIFENGYSFTPKASYEMRQVAQEENEALKKENTLLKAQNKALADQAEFHESVLEEIIITIHS